MTYQPGTHLIASLQTKIIDGLVHSQPTRDLLLRLVAECNLSLLGEVFHDFGGGGFTAVVCLSESHISVHTWPEHGLVNLDIYLSNYLRNNDGTVQTIFDAITQHFAATVLQHQTIIR